MTLKINVSERFAESNKHFPLYEKYSADVAPQLACISLDLRTGAVSANSNSSPGATSVPAEVFHNLVVHFPVSPFLKGPALDTLINEISPQLQAVLDGSSVVWERNNQVGKLNDTAEAAMETLCQALDELSPTEYENCMTSLAEILASSPFPEDGDYDLTAFYQGVLDSNGDDGIFFSNDKSLTVSDVEDEVLDMWVECLHNDEELPHAVEQALIDDGRCNTYGARP